MNYSMVTAVLLGAIGVLTLVEGHEDLYISCCQTNDISPEDEVQLDGEEMYYYDFKNKKTVMTLPPFSGPWQAAEGWAGLSEANHKICLGNVETVTKAEQSPPEEIDAPQITVYPRNEVRPGMNSILICFVNNFFPPPVKVKWAKNNAEVKEGVTLSRYYPNSDFTFHQISTLSITPEEGDVYSCTVEHKGLSEPETRIWEPDFQNESNMAMTAFCGIGLTLGLLGVGLGTFFLIKGNNCN